MNSIKNHDNHLINVISGSETESPPLKRRLNVIVHYELCIDYARPDKPQTHHRRLQFFQENFFNR